MNQEQKQLFYDMQYEEQVVDQYLSGDTASRVLATLEYYTYRSINKSVPGIFAKYNGKNNSGMTKNLNQLKRQLKTHVLSFLASHQDMINLYGSYPFPENLSEKECKNFITTCKNLVKDPEVKVYCDHLLLIIKKDYQKVLDFYYKNQQKGKRPEMDPQTQINKFMPAIGQADYNAQKAAKMAQEGNYKHTIDINEKAKKTFLIQNSFNRCLNSLKSYISGKLSEDYICSELKDFCNEFKANEDYFSFPPGLDNINIKEMLNSWSKKSDNAFLYCSIFGNILARNYLEVEKGLLR